MAMMASPTGQNGVSTIEDVRSLIQPSAEDERLLKGFAKSDPAVCRWVSLALAFRRAVLREFDRLA